MTVLASGKECLICEARKNSSVEQTYIILLWLWEGYNLQQLVDEMCFFHRRRFDIALEEASEWAESE